MTIRAVLNPEMERQLATEFSLAAESEATHREWCGIVLERKSQLSGSMMRAW